MDGKAGILDEYTEEERYAIVAFHIGVTSVAEELFRFAMSCKLGTKPSTSAVGTKVLLLIVDEMAKQGMALPQALHEILRVEYARICAKAMANVADDERLTVRVPNSGVTE